MSDIEEGTVERVVAGGAGLLRRQGPVCFVRGVLPGERVRYRLVGKERGVLTGELIELLESSAERVAPPCPYYSDCGGCEIQEISYREQLRLKREILLEQLIRIGGFESPQVEETRGGSPYGYRTRLRLHRDKRGEYGFRRRRSREIVPVDRCIVATDAVNRALHHLPDGESGLPEIIVAEHDRGVVRSDRPEAVSVTLLGRRVWFSGAGFFQSNHSMFEALLRELLELADPAGGLNAGYTLYDLYAGTGAIASVVAYRLQKAGVEPARAIHCVEPDAASAQFVSKNLSDFPFSLHQRALEQFVAHREPPGEEAVIIVDPPRAGLSEAARRWLLRAQPRQLFYVSCDPSTFARDLGVLSQGYAVKRIIPFDFFPQTSHIETLALLTSKGAP